MKKFPKEWFQAQLKQAVRRHRRRLLRRQKGDRNRRTERRTLLPPAVLSFQKSYKDTVGFLNEFRDATLLGPIRTYVHVDLTVIEEISVPVAIVLAAEFNRWQLKKGVRLTVQDADKWRPKVRNLLSDLGVFELLGVNRPRQANLDEIDNITLTPLQSGLRLDGKKLNRLQTRFKSMLEGLTSNSGVYEGLLEAAENVISHAYPADFKPAHSHVGHRWWGAGCLDLDTQRLRFFVFDQGAGIPYTLPSNDLYEEIREWLANNLGGIAPNDTVMLRAALETGRTRTGASHRGLGLRRMAEVVEGTGTGYLRIISRRGEIIYHSDGTIVSRDHSESVGGTLIEWCLPADALSSVGEGTNEDD